METYILSVFEDENGETHSHIMQAREIETADSAVNREFGPVFMIYQARIHGKIENLFEA